MANKAQKKNQIKVKRRRDKNYVHNVFFYHWKKQNKKNKLKTSEMDMKREKKFIDKPEEKTRKRVNMFDKLKFRNKEIKNKTNKIQRIFSNVNDCIA